MMMDQSSGDDLAPIYRRELPGGGYVAIDIRRGQELPRCRVSVERRADQERRSGHPPIVIAEEDGDERSAAFGHLYRIATDNAAIARALLRIEGRAD
jgi:hypothetical protein